MRRRRFQPDGGLKLVPRVTRELAYGARWFQREQVLPPKDKKGNLLDVLVARGLMDIDVCDRPPGSVSP